MHAAKHGSSHPSSSSSSQSSSEMTGGAGASMSTMSQSMSSAIGRSLRSFVLQLPPAPPTLPTPPPSASAIFARGVVSFHLDRFFPPRFLDFSQFLRDSREARKGKEHDARVREVGSSGGAGKMDINAMLQGVSEKEKQRLMVSLEEMQMKEQVSMYNGLVERCFANCVQSFQSKTLDSKEERCVTRCTAKFIKASARAGQTFQELGAPGPGGAAGGGGAAGQ